MFDYHDRYRDFVRLVTIENIHGAKYLEQLKTFRSRNASVIATIEDLLARGVASEQLPGMTSNPDPPTSDDQLAMLSPRQQSVDVRHGVRARPLASAPASQTSRNGGRCKSEVRRWRSISWPGAWGLQNHWREQVTALVPAHGDCPRRIHDARYAARFRRRFRRAGV